MTRNRCWIMARRPHENEFQRALELTEGTIPALQPGDVLIRNAYLSMDAGTRMYLTPRTDSYSPPSAVGSAVQGMVLGEIVESCHPDLRPGDLVRAYGQWADYSLSRPDDTYVRRVSWRCDDYRQYLAVLGPNGWTAYVGILEIGAARSGETVVVSSAAGATGALAGQIAKAHGCRVIGLTGSDAKCEWITRQLGFDAAINYRSANLSSELARICPRGVDLYFDNVGGPILETLFTHMALYGRIAVCGLITAYSHDSAPPGPRNYDQVLMKRLRIQGFFSPDFYARELEINAKLRSLADSGRMKMRFDLTSGLERTVDAYTRLFAGDNIGKTLVELTALSANRNTLGLFA